MSNQIRLKVVSQYSVTAYSNVLTYVKSAASTVYITNETFTAPGVRTYKLHVEGETFVGFANLQGEKNANTRNGVVSESNCGSLFIPNINDYGQFAQKSVPITLPVGVYDFEIRATGNPRSNTLDLYVNAVISFGYDQTMNGLAETSVDLSIPAN